ncbi:MAG: LLM class flavin-dependent oxidoreductase [Acidimicrobiales bacterium]|nr:LLM class flavin-dependent oxidoreductase [Acidimicrobiales bacterium]
MSEVLDVPLSVLDLAPVGEGSSAAEALRASLDLVVEAERLGYRRYWVAEHHNMPGIASSAPAVLLAHLASRTSTIRLGSGGVMLPNHAPLVIAEQFGMLEALHPGRIDLGIGRAPGTDPAAAAALRRSRNLEPELPTLLGELLGFFNGTFPDDHPYRRITAVPGLGYQPDLWLLGSSDYSARLAGLLGLPFSFAHHFSAGNTLPALEVYRSSFRPSPVLDEPYVMLGVAVLCADTHERACWLARPGDLAFLRLRSGRPGRFPTPEEAADFHPTPAEREAIRNWSSSRIIGDPAGVLDKLRALVATTAADELMVTTMVHGDDDRVRSLRLVADLTGVPRTS